jgi:hypothetical protein
MKKLFKWVGIVFGVLFAIVVVVGMTSAPTPSTGANTQASTSTTKAAAPEQLTTVTASQLARDYEENTVAADQKYKGKKFIVTGTVSDINTDIMGRPYVTLRGTNEFMAPHFSFDKSAGNQLAKLRKGVKVTLACEGAGDMAKIPMSEDCQFHQ